MGKTKFQVGDTVTIIDHYYGGDGFPKGSVVKITSIINCEDYTRTLYGIEGRAADGYHYHFELVDTSVEVGDTVYMLDDYFSSSGVFKGDKLTVSEIDSGGYKPLYYFEEVGNACFGSRFSKIAPAKPDVPEAEQPKVSILPEGFNIEYLMDIAEGLDGEEQLIDFGFEDGKKVFIESTSAYLARFIRALDKHIKEAK